MVNNAANSYALVEALSSLLPCVDYLLVYRKVFYKLPAGKRVIGRIVINVYGTVVKSGIKVETDQLN